MITLVGTNQGFKTVSLVFFELRAKNHLARQKLDYFCNFFSVRFSEVNNPIKITAMVTLVGTHQGLKAVECLFFEL